MPSIKNRSIPKKFKEGEYNFRIEKAKQQFELDFVDKVEIIKYVNEFFGGKWRFDYAEIKRDFNLESKQDINAEAFIDNTVDAGVSSLRKDFLKRVPEGGTILDLGCGSGRDSKAFINTGYEVVAVDGSTALSKAASEFIGQSVICTTFQEYEPQVYFDGIWACVSLLHLEKKDIHDVIEKLGKKLNAGGCFYMSFKYGKHAGERNGRFFSDMTEESFAELIEDLTDLTIEEKYISSDARPGRADEKWLNVFLRKK